MPNTVTLINGSINITSGRQALAAAGKMYTATNPTPGTAIAYANKTSFSATANGFFAVQNKNPLGGPSIYWDRLRLIQTATAPTGTICRGEIYTEAGLVSLTTAVATITPVNVNPSFAMGSQALVQFFSAGAATVPAAVNTRNLIGLWSVGVGVSVANDSITLEFGADGLTDAKGGQTAARATDPADMMAWAKPVIVAPGMTAWMNLWGPAANVPSYEFEFNYFEL